MKKEPLKSSLASLGASLLVVVGDGESFITWMGPNAQEANYAAEFAKAILSRAMLAEYGLG